MSVLRFFILNEFFVFLLFIFFNCLTNTKISDIKWMTSLYLYRPSYSNGLIFLDVRAFQCVLLSIVQQKIVLHVKFTTTIIKSSRMFFFFSNMFIFPIHLCIFFCHNWRYTRVKGREYGRFSGKRPTLKGKFQLNSLFLITSYRFITDHFLPIWPPMVAYHKCHKWTKF